MTVKSLIRHLSSIKEELQNKEIKIIYPNGIPGDFDIKFVLNDPMNMDKTNENVDYIIITS